MTIQLEVLPVILGSTAYIFYRFLCSLRSCASPTRDKLSGNLRSSSCDGKSGQTFSSCLDPESPDTVDDESRGAIVDEPFAEPSPANENGPRKRAAAQSAFVACLLIALVVFAFQRPPRVEDHDMNGNETFTIGPLNIDSKPSAAATIDLEPLSNSDTDWLVQSASTDHDHINGSHSDLSYEDTMPAFTLPLTRQAMRTTLPSGAIHHRSAYWGTLQVGMPAKPYKVVFDTGSGLLILPSAYCQTETCRKHTRYRRSASSSAIDIDLDGSESQRGQPRDQITVSFGTGKVEGVFVNERICVGPQKDDVSLGASTEGESSKDCMRMGMVAATDMTAEPFLQFEFDGVLGLGLSGLSQGPGFNFLHNVGKTMGASADRPNTFAVFLAMQEERTSEIAFGGWDQSKYTGKLGWSKVLHPDLGHWLVQIESVRVDDTIIPFCEDGTCKAVVDTGTSLMSVPPKAFSSIYQPLRHIDVDGSGCAGLGPRLHFDMVSLYGKAFTMTLEPEDYARVDIKNSQGTSPLYVNFGERPAEEPQTHCRASMMAMDMPAPIGPKLFIFGEPMLRRYYTIYDTDDPPKIGFGHVPRSPRAVATGEDDQDDDSWFWEEEQ